jgi:hypothetical protein
MEYFSLVSIPSSKIAVAFHWMFLGNRSAALVENGETTNASSKIKKPNALLSKCFRNMIVSSAEHLIDARGMGANELVREDAHLDNRIGLVNDRASWRNRGKIHS